jgi:hypothetical protein
MAVFIVWTLICVDSNEIVFGIHYKPTYTDVVIPAASNHPVQHKLSAFDPMLNRVNILPLSAEGKSKELGVIKVIAENNGYSEKFSLNAFERRNYKSKENHNTLKRFDGVQNNKKKMILEF